MIRIKFKTTLSETKLDIELITDVKKIQLMCVNQHATIRFDETDYDISIKEYNRLSNILLGLN